MAAKFQPAPACTGRSGTVARVAGNTNLSPCRRPADMVGDENTAGEQEAEEQPLTKRQRKRAKQLEEERLRMAEQRQLADPAPQSALEFERLVCLLCMSATVTLRKDAALLHLGMSAQLLDHPSCLGPCGL